MVKRQHIRRASAEQIEAMRARGESRSDWQAAEAMAPADIERLADEEDGALPAGWESTVDVGLPERREPIHIRLDPEVLRWFKAHGPGYQTRINAGTAGVRAGTAAGETGGVVRDVAEPQAHGMPMSNGNGDGHAAHCVGRGPACCALGAT